MKNSTKTNGVSKDTVILNGEKVRLDKITMENVKKYFNVMDKLSMVSGSVPRYNSSLSPIENMNRMLSDTIIMEGELRGDWNDAINGVFDIYLHETFEEHKNRVFKEMSRLGVGSSLTMWNGKMFTVRKDRITNSFNIFESGIGY